MVVAITEGFVALRRGSAYGRRSTLTDNSVIKEAGSMRIAIALYDRSPRSTLSDPTRGLRVCLGRA